MLIFACSCLIPLLKWTQHDCLSFYVWSWWSKTKDISLFNRFRSKNKIASKGGVGGLKTCGDIVREIERVCMIRAFWRKGTLLMLETAWEIARKLPLCINIVSCITDKGMRPILTNSGIAFTSTIPVQYMYKKIGWFPSGLNFIAWQEFTIICKTMWPIFANFYRCFMLFDIFSKQY